MKFFFLLIFISCSTNFDSKKNESNLSFLNFLTRFSSISNITNGTGVGTETISNYSVIITPTLNFTTDAGGLSLIKVKLSHTPTSIVRVDLASLNLSEGIVSNSSLNFNSTNFATEQIATLTGVVDSIYDLTNPTYKVKVTIITSDTNYSNLQIPDLDFTNNESGKLIYATNQNVLGNLGGGISGADNICNTDPNKPIIPSSFKAMVALNGTREACQSANCTVSSVSENIDWVFRPNTKYYRNFDKFIIFTSTAAGVFNFGSFANSFGGSGNAWTGLNTDWTKNNTNNCSNWTDGSSGFNGRIGQINSTGNPSIQAGDMACNTASIKLICVEQ